jgi:hypothetical protein
MIRTSTSHTPEIGHRDRPLRAASHAARARRFVGALVMCLLAGCSATGEGPRATPIGPTTSTTASQERATGIPSDVSVERHLFAAREGSGVVSSSRDPDLLWAIRDSGPSTPGKPRAALYGYRVVDGRLSDVAPGRRFAIIPLLGGADDDWEDIARDDQGNLWIADTGDNDCKRRSVALLKVREPDPRLDRPVRPLATYRFRYPDPKPGCRGWNAESLLVVDGTAYVITKASRPTLYRVPRLDASHEVVAERIGFLSPASGIDSSYLTGADLSTDHRRLAVANYGAVFVYESSRGGRADEALLTDLIRRPPRWTLPLGCMSCPTASQVEGVAFRFGTHDLDLLSESRDIWFVPASSYQRR